MPDYVQRRQRATRYQVYWPVLAGHRTSGPVCGQIQNISVSGMLFLSEATYVPGDRVEAQIEIREDCLVRAVLEIVRTRRSVGDWQAYGARLVRISECDAAVLRHAIAAMTPRTFVKQPQAPASDGSTLHRLTRAG